MLSFASIAEACGRLSVGQAMARLWTPSFIISSALYVVWRFTLNAGVGWFAPGSTAADAFFIMLLGSTIPCAFINLYFCKEERNRAAAEAKREVAREAEAKRQAAEREAEAKRQAAEREAEAKRQAAERKRQAAEREVEAKRQAAAHSKEREERAKTHAKKLEESAKRQAAKDKADAAKIKADAELEADARAAEDTRQAELSAMLKAARGTRGTVAGVAAWSTAAEAAQKYLAEKEPLAQKARAASERADQELSRATALNTSEHKAAEQEHAKATEKAEQAMRDAMTAAAKEQEGAARDFERTTQQRFDEQRRAAAEAMEQRLAAADAALAGVKAALERANQKLSMATTINNSEHEAATQEHTKATEKAEQAMRDAMAVAAAGTTEEAAKAVQQAMQPTVDAQRNAATAAMEMRLAAADATLADAKAAVERADQELSRATAVNKSEHEAATQEHATANAKAEQDMRNAMTRAATAKSPQDVANAVQQAMQATVDAQRKAAEEAMEMRLTAADAALSDAKYEAAKRKRALEATQSDLQKANEFVKQTEDGVRAAREAEEDEATRAAKLFKTKGQPKTLDEWRTLEQPLKEAGLTSALVLEYKEGKRCSFWFVRADQLRSFSGTTPPNLQDLRRTHPDWLVQHTVDFLDGFRGTYKGKFLVVSHCWEQPSQPDAKGVQFKTLKNYLNEKRSIEWVWFE